jgi:hypothetical protein
MMMHHHTPPHATTRHHTPPHATTRHHTPPHATTRHHKNAGRTVPTILLKSLLNCENGTFFPAKGVHSKNTFFVLLVGHFSPEKRHFFT